jgi:hypothetical protein
MVVRMDYGVRLLGGAGGALEISKPSAVDGRRVQIVAVALHELDIQ